MWCYSRNSVFKDNPNFAKGISEALFYYVDKFVLLSSGNSLFMYKYYLDFTKDDLKRLERTDSFVSVNNNLEYSRPGLRLRYLEEINFFPGFDYTEC